MSTLSNRIKFSFFFFYATSISAVLFMAWYLLEDLENTTLAMDKQVEIEHFLNRQETDVITNIQSALLTLTYLPAGTSSYESLPIIFNGLPIPFEGEVDFLGAEYSVIINQIPEGTFYFAKDLSLFEEHEIRMMQTLYILGFVSLLLGLGFAYLLSRRISKPIQSLTNDIQNVKQGKKETYLPESYKDEELSNISKTLNHYLHELDHLIERERSMITMASHELRTPIAVIMGAAEVIQKRQNLNAEDQKTFDRIVNAASIMSSNVKVLISLVQQRKNKVAWTEFSLLSMNNELIDYIMATDPDSAKRIVISPTQDVTINSNKEMVRMLLENLVINGLKHNQGLVSISYSDSYLEISDEGIIAESSHQSILAEQLSSSGLGLYITNLICEELGWEFSLSTSDKGESSARVTFSAA